MRQGLLGAVLRLLIAAVLVAPLLQAASGSAQALDAEETSFLSLINRLRASQGLPTLKLSPKLTAASAWYARDMASKNYFKSDHTDSLGRTAGQRLRAFGYTYQTYTAENIAAGQAAGTAVYTTWFNSSGHKANMLSPYMRAIGVDRAYSSTSRYGWYWVTDFGGVVDTATAERAGGYSSLSGSYYQYRYGKPVSIAGSVSPAFAGKSVKVTVQKRVYSSAAGQWVWKDYSYRYPTLSSGSSYSTAFYPARGRYRVRAYFNGGGISYVRGSFSPFRYFDVK